jgi:hypothetical protein
MLPRQKEKHVQFSAPNHVTHDKNMAVAAHGDERPREAPPKACPRKSSDLASKSHLSQRFRPEKVTFQTGVITCLANKNKNKNRKIFAAPSGAALPTYKTDSEIW